jgi:pimeloyl-ACP methyl ester carboxylesterase
MNIDYFEKGEGQTVILLHSTAAGNRQWRHLIDFLCDDHHLIAPNLYGYGATDKWAFQRPQTLKNQAELIRQFIPSDGRKFSLVGHSFDGSVAMMAAKLFQHHIDKLILIEPNPFYLIRDLGHDSTYNEVMALYDCIKPNGANGDWGTAGAVFAD